MTNVTISKWGGRSAIRVLKAVMDELGAVEGQEIDVSMLEVKAILRAEP